MTMRRGSTYQDFRQRNYDDYDFDRLFKVVEKMVAMLNQQVLMTRDNPNSHPAVENNANNIVRFKRLKPPTFVGGRDPMIAEVAATSGEDF